MSEYIASIPLGNIERIAIIPGGGRSMAQVKGDADYICNAGFYSMTTGKPVGHLKVDGAVLSKEIWGCWGYAWDKADIRLAALPAGAKNYISGVEMLTPMIGIRDAMLYNPEVGGVRPRTAMALAGDKLLLYCADSPATPETLRESLYKMGAETAIMLDGGGSSQCDFAGQKISSSRRVHNYLAVWLRKKEDEPMSEAYQVTPSVGVNIRSGPGTGYSKVGAYAQGTVVTVTATRDGWGQTEKGWVSLDYLEAVEAAQRVTDNGLCIQARYIDAGRKNRPGSVNPCGYITIHETGNAARGADAAAHGSYLNSAAGEAALVSWHYTVDDHAIVQHLPDGETAYHAGDGPKGTGNARSIGVEICVNADGDFAKARENAASLVRLLMEEHGIPIGHVVQHNHWNGKDCPYTIRHTSGAWEAFLALCEGGPCAKTNRQTVQARFGLAEETMDYLEAYRYGADLLQKLAAAN